MAKPPTPPEELAPLLEWIWSALSLGVRDRHSGFHLGTLATIGPGGEPRARVVVTRAVHPGTGTVICHTDLRSDKVGEIRASPAVSWLWYDKDSRVQIRGVGRATVHASDPLARERWDASPLSSRRCYLADPGPGTESPVPASGLPEGLGERLPEPEESEAAFPHFAVIRTDLHAIEYLWLASQGHRRARFHLTPLGWRGTWLIP